MDSIKEIYYKITDKISEEHGDPKKLLIIGIVGFILISYFVMILGQLINPARALSGRPVDYNPLSLLVNLFTNPEWFLIILAFFGAGILVYFATKVYGERMGDGEVDPITKRKYSKEKQLGDAHFLQKNEIRSFLDITPVDKIQGVPLGKYTKDIKDCVSIPVVPKGKNPLEKYKHKVANGNILTIGGSGSGKTYNFVVPYLYKVIDRRESFISTDTKGEVFSEIYFYALKNNYTIKVFNCDEPEKGDGIHLLKIVGTDPERADLISNVLIKNSIENPNNSAQQYWEDMLHQLLMACMLFITYEYEDEYKKHLNRIEIIKKDTKIPTEEKMDKINDENSEWEKKTEPIHGYGTIGRMYDFINSRLYTYDENEGIWVIGSNGGDDNQYDYISRLFTVAFKEAKGYHPAQAPWKRFNNFKAENRDNAIGTLATRLSKFQHDSVRQAFGKDDIDIEMPGEKPCAFFAIINPLDKSKKIISSVFFTLMTRTLLDSAKKKPTLRLRITTNVVMDEYFSVGVLPGIEEAVSLCRSHGMNLIFILQGRSQLMEMHPKGYQTIESNCGVILNLGAGAEENTLKFTEKMSGTTTVQTDMMGYNRSTIAPFEVIHDMNSRRGMSEQALVTESDALHLPRDMVLIFIPPNQTIRLYKLGKHEMPQNREIKDLPPRNIYLYKQYKDKDKNFFKDVKMLPTPAMVTPTYDPLKDPVGYNLNQVFGNNVIKNLNPNEQNQDPLFTRDTEQSRFNFDQGESEDALGFDLDDWDSNGLS